MSKLDGRLAMCAGFVRQGSRIADIGTDHAYLPVWLCQNGICPSAIAADINPEPLKRGALTVAEACLSDVIELRLSDGLKAISAEEADDIVISGMGGELIAKIISECNFAKNADKQFVLQPMTKSEALIKWLCENGFEIKEQDCCAAGNKCYTVLKVKYTGNTSAKDELYYYLAELRPRENKTHLRFVEGHINRLLKQANGDVRFAVLAKRLTEIVYE